MRLDYGLSAIAEWAWNEEDSAAAKGHRIRQQLKTPVTPISILRLNWIAAENIGFFGIEPHAQPHLRRGFFVERTPPYGGHLGSSYPALGVPHGAHRVDFARFRPINI